MTGKKMNTGTMKNNYRIFLLILIAAGFLFLSTASDAQGMLGDVNGDGAISIIDALLTAQFYVGLNPDNFNESLADVDADQSIDIVDALLIAQYYVGLIDTFPGQTEPEDIIAWLDAHPVIAGSIVWYGPGAAGGIPSYFSEWTEDQIDGLVQAYQILSTGQSTNLPEAPDYTLTLAGDGDVWSTNLDEDLAWDYYCAYIAQSLVNELYGLVSWSVLEYSPEELELLFDSRSLFEWGSGPEKYMIMMQHNLLFDHGTATPGDPGRIKAYLVENGLVGSTPVETIANLLEWCRTNMIHFYGSYTPENLEKHWQYEGYPPVERMLAGTIHEDYPEMGVRHWTAGCWGTVGFLRTVLRTVNIPVRLEKRCGHALVNFEHEGLYLTHGDDPYNSFAKATPPFPASELLINQSDFDLWFGENVSDSEICNNVGRRTRDLALIYLPDTLLSYYCEDIAAGLSHADGKVYESLSRNYTVADLEAIGLWEQMDIKLQATGGCDN
jgi:hypothetical protein